MLRFGPDNGPTAVIALPLLEEANRTRAFAVTLLRALAARGVGGALPDLPGTGESIVATADTSLARLRGGFAAAVARIGGRCHSVAIRSGALIDTSAPVASHWHLAPVDGTTTVRDWRRVSGDPGDWLEEGPPVVVAGNAVSRALLAELQAVASPGAEDVKPLRTIRLATDPAAADRKPAGTPLWRRAEPGNDPALAATLAGDIADWIAHCEA